MLDLLDSIRRLRASGARITVFPFDQARRESSRGRDRDAEMAKQILAVRAQAPGDLFLVLAGNVHAMKKKMTIGGTEVVPMGFYLEPCGSHQMAGKSRGDARYIELTSSDERGFDGIFYVPSLTASPPAAADR